MGHFQKQVGVQINITAKAKATPERKRGYEHAQD